jgi:hypothetical protein
MLDALVGGERDPQILPDLARAIVAIGMSLLVIVRHPLADPEARYQAIGPDHCDKRIGPERIKRNHIRQVEALAYRVTREPGA